MVDQLVIFNERKKENKELSTCSTKKKKRK